MLNAEELAAAVAALDLHTPRLRLRHTTAADFEVQVEHEMNTTIMANIRDPLPLDEVREIVKDFNATWVGKEGSWVGLTIERSGDVIGFVFLNLTSHECQSMELGYRLHPDYWRQGYTAEAGHALLEFCRDVLKVRKMVAYVVKGNDASGGLLKKLGFQDEGCLRQHSQLGGKWCDEMVYGLIMEEM